MYGLFWAFVLGRNFFVYGLGFKVWLSSPTWRVGGLST